MKWAVVCLLAFILGNGTARADMRPPGYKSVPCDINVEAAHKFSDYVFFATYYNTAERIEIEPNMPYMMPQAKQQEFLSLYAFPREQVAETGEKTLLRYLKGQNHDVSHLGGYKFPYLRRTLNIQRIDLRTEAHAYYRIDRINPEEGVVLTWLGGGEEEKASNLSRIVSGLALTLAFSLGGLWVVRRFRNRQRDLLQAVPKLPVN